MRDGGRQLVQHVALGRDEARLLGPRAFEVLPVERIASDAVVAQRHLDHFHHPPLAMQRRGHDAGHHLTAIHREFGGLTRRLAIDSLEQLDPLPDHLRGIIRLDRLHIGAVDQREMKVAIPIPHRQRRSFDQAGKRLQRIAQQQAVLLQLRNALLAFGRVENPEDHAAHIGEVRPGGRAPDQQRAARSNGLHRAREALAATLRGLHILRQCLPIFVAKASFAFRQF